jgi:hypothetical protein
VDSLDSFNLLVLVKLRAVAQGQAVVVVFALVT